MVEGPIANGHVERSPEEVVPIHWTEKSPIQLEARRRAMGHHGERRGYWHQKWGQYYQGHKGAEASDAPRDVQWRLTLGLRQDVVEDPTILG